VLLAALAVVLAGCGVKKEKTVIAPPTSQNDGVLLHPPSAAPAFLLHDQAGKLVGPQQDRGHWTIVTFLYTHCPDVCPLIATQLGIAQRQASDLRVIAVSVDPKRDTPAAVKRFLAAHRLGPRFRYVTGARAALRPVWTKYHIASQPGPNGTVSHSTYEILIDRQGRERVFFDSQMTARDVTQMLKHLS
jgi:protein SCO1/2